MGCFNSKPNDAGATRRRPGSIGEVAVFIPGLRVPETLELPQPPGDGLPRRLTERLVGMRSRIEAMSVHEALSVMRPRKRTFTQHERGDLEDKMQFSWMNQEDDAEETALPSAWYEVLSVLHMMAMLRLSQANSLLLPKTSLEGYHAKVSEENKRASVEIFLKASGYLECAIQHVLPRISPENRKGLPVDLAEGVLKAICMQALGQAIDVQLGLAIDSPKATLAVKRRNPPPVCGSMKYLHEKIQKDSSCKVRINKDLYSNDSIHEAVPALPDFAVALKPDEYRLPLTDGDILFLHMKKDPIRTGEIVVFNVEVHERRSDAAEVDILTKGIPSFPCYLPYVGWLTILMKEKPVFKYLLIGALGLLVMTSKE
ncbi:hypothetical protein PR202_ga03460 [Eleusine coracana subsp. coracana]|uniref:BRO1 domain-containing protein n=1 Tax=Eleusine coracana subsp. coracana TaxID=191504 RepID=A0AAV5BP71_ELECO|nr:hypothetical protein PR202_ga03460 [Eleusine coracana subsp. coracana]